LCAVAQAARALSAVAQAACVVPALALLVLSSACVRSADPPLPALKLDPARVAVVGLSSGAYMATQAHLAYSDRLVGAGLIAGGPYGCALGTLKIALGACMTATPSPPDAAALAAVARERSSLGAIAPLSGLSGDRVLVLHGRGDLVVAEPVSHAVAGFYRELADSLAVPLDVEWEGQRDFGHVMPTEAAGGDCAGGKPPYVGRCRFDGAGRVLRHLFPADANLPPGKGDGELRRFDQRAYQPEGEDALLGDSGYLYVPKRCSAGDDCGLLIAFHGCQQDSDSIGEAFVREAGFNRWADAMALVVLYPQARASYLPLNPKACWDWWGYSGPDYDTRKGVQLRWLARASAALGVPLE
jgi:hypothetical protein